MNIRFGVNVIVKKNKKKAHKRKIQNLKDNEKKRIANQIKREEGIKSQIYATAKKQRITNFKITSVRKKQSLYTVFYVSNKPQDDKEEFRDVAIKLEKIYNSQFEFIHIKKQDGKYVTICDI